MQESRINRFLGIEEEDLPDGRCVLRLALREDFLNEVGLVHGGVPTLLLDGAMGRMVSRTLERDEGAATVQFSVQFLRPASGKLVARAEILRRGRRAVFVQGECRDEKGNLVAQAHGTWAIFPAPAPGYTAAPTQRRRK